MYYYKRGMSNFLNFHGRDTRREYWMFVLVVVLIFLAAFAIDLSLAGMATDNAGTGLFATIVNLIHFIPLLAAGIRRLHDTDRTGWWYLLVFVPLIGSLILLVLLCLRGTNGANKHGPDKLGGPPSGMGDPGFGHTTAPHDRPLQTSPPNRNGTNVPR